ncbi:MAG TPA: signal peptide peptidase SppA [Gammaproteobacteria bacterium]|nr:signal peptide peptidase SppA [Gammaproteobacteria bacterium]
MDSDNRSLPLRIVAGIWRGLDRLRRFLHLIFMLGIFLLLLIAAIGERVYIPGTAALVIAPQGALVDQLSGDALGRAIAKAQGAPLQETLVRDVVEALRAARDDERIKAVVLDLDGMTGAGLSKLQEIAAEIVQFKQSGKPVIAVGDGFTRDQYYLAAQADNVYMHPMGLVLVDGYSRFLPYYKSLLDKAYVDYNVWTVGEYKSFVEPITRDDMSPQDEEASRLFLNGLWAAYQADVTAARELAAPALQQYADDIVTLLEESGGDSAKLAVDYGLVDELLTRDAMRERIREAIGEDAAREQTSDDYTEVSLEAYVAALDTETPPEVLPSKIAVIVASGTILDGAQPPGAIGGDSTAQLVRQARADDAVKALVLRVDSGGGSAFASDVILRELERFQETGRPVVVSMGSVAASGGYWISMGADEIWASPTTLTGSIGVGATIPTIPRTLDWLGVHVDGIGTTKLAGALEITRPLGDEVKGLIGLSIRKTYDDFVRKVAEHRERTVEEIDAAAHGRVWTGADALDRGLVDKLGTLSDAIDSAAELAGLERGTYSLDYVEQQLGVAERLVLSLTAKAAVGVDHLVKLPRLPTNVTQALESTLEPLAFLDRLNDPRGIYVYCFCDTK